MQDQKEKTEQMAEPALTQMAQLIEDFRFVPLASKEQIEGLAAFIGYRAQLALYEILKEEQAELSWAEYVKTVCTSRRIRKAVQTVAMHAVKRFDYSLLDFTLPEDALEYIDENDTEDHKIAVSKVFSKARGHGIVQFAILKTELEHYHYLSAKKPGYTWREYIQELMDDKELWNSAARAFQHGLRQIDFRESWLTEEIKETSFLRKKTDQSLEKCR